MCEYSLEAYRSTPARQGETYQTKRFPSGTVGFVAPKDTTTAVCIACDTQLTVSNIPSDLKKMYGFGDTERATMTHVERGNHRDGLQFANGVRLSLQELPGGITATVAGLLETEAPAIREGELELA